MSNHLVHFNQSNSHQSNSRRSHQMKQTFRAIIAIDITTAAKAELSRLASLLKSQCKGSYPTSDMYHMTIAFLGDITDLQASALCRVLTERMQVYTPFELTLCRLGYFAQPDSATVFCSTEQSDTLLSLAQDVYRAAWDVQIPFDEKKFRAHITLGRRVDLSPIRLNTISVQRISFTVSGLTLYKSTLTPSGPIYTPLQFISF